MENIRCRLCGAQSYQVHLVREDLSLSLPGSFRLVRCDECGLVYLNPSPAESELNALYAGEYDQYTVAVEDEPSGLTRLARRYGLRKRIRAITAHRAAGRLLDVGCATGDFIAQMRDDAGWEVYGLEIDPAAAQYARERLGLQVREGTLAASGFPDAYFDAVTMWNVLEHLYDPMAALREVARILKPAGLLSVTTPLLDTVGARMFGRYWIGYELPRHLSVFTAATLARLLREAGFTVIERRCLYGGYAAAASSVRFWLRAQRGLPDRIRRALERLLFSPVLRIGLAPLFYVAGSWAGMCSIPTITAEKNAR